MAETCVLGCPDTRVYILDYCGGQTLCDITDSVTFTKWGRELDHPSEVEITVHLSGDSGGQACCDCLSSVRTWRNEILIVRGGEVVWGPGPIVTIYLQRHIAHLTARDISAWLGVRLVHNDYDFQSVDLATIAQTVVEDALTSGDAALLPASTRDACILDFAEFTETGIETKMEIRANTTSALEVLDTLSGQGLDYTVVNRSLHVGTNFAFGPIGPLRDEDFLEDLQVAERGLAAATKWYVSSDTAQGSCGGIDDFFFLVERGVEGAPAETNQTDLNMQACDRLGVSNPPPLVVSAIGDGRLSQNAPVCINTLVPGTLVDLAIKEMCRPASLRERITSLRVTVEDRGEKISVTLAPESPLSQDEATG